MSPKSKKEYLKSIVPRYRKADRKQKKIILDEFCNVCGYHRKYAIKLLNNTLVRVIQKPKKNKKSGRRPKYNKKPIINALKKIWESSNYPCSKRLKFIIPIWIPHYETEFEFLSEENRSLVLKISPASIDRLLKPIRPKFNKRGLSTTKPGSLIKKRIPIQTNQWDETKPGFVEADTVAHCGSSTAGQYALTIDLVDIATGWTEQRAIWGKGQLTVKKQINHIEQALPFPLLGFDSDNGSEFLNYHLLHFFTERKRPVKFTRSRPYKHNDNAHVEQKNWSIIRQWLGYSRFDNPETVPLLNNLYTSEWRLYHNFFLPSVKLIDKKRIGSQIIKKHDDPRTPFQRLLASKHISNNIKHSLEKQFLSLNPFKLLSAIEKKLDLIFLSVSFDSK